MERLTNEEVRVDESMDRYLGPRSVLECMKPKLLDLVLNGPVLNSVSKAALRQIIRQLYSALAAYEDTGLTPEEAKRMSNILMDVGIDYNCSWEYVKNWLLDTRLRELAEADKAGRLVVHARWAHLGGDEWCCSACGFVITTEGSWDKPTKKYCEDCGARMDGGDNNAAD